MKGGDVLVVPHEGPITLPFFGPDSGLQPAANNAPVNIRTARGPAHLRGALRRQTRLALAGYDFAKTAKSDFRPARSQ